MATLKLIIRKDSCRTEAVSFHPTNKLTVAAFNSKLKDLSIITEDQGGKSVYYTPSSRRGFIKKDPIEFRKVWLEYERSDRDYEVELAVG